MVFFKSIAFFLAGKQENRKGSAIGLRRKTFYTLVCKGKRGDFYGVFELILRIGLSILLGFFIGLERQITGHPAGIRTNVLISMGACLFMMFPLMSGTDEVYRIASYIISGVGFLCSGVIFKESGTVRGLNTAATLWCTAAVGVLSSSGNYLFAVTAAGMLIVSNLLFRPIAIKINPVARSEESEKVYRISATCQEAAETEIRSLIINSNTCRTLFLTNLESSDVIGDKVEIQADFLSVGRSKAQTAESIVSRLLTVPSVVRAGWELL